jgi:predicted outer membrane repeat protein
MSTNPIQKGKATHTRMAALVHVGGWRLTVHRRVLIRRLVLCLALAGWLVPTHGGAPVAAAGTTRYVAPAGSDSGDCSMSTSPCKTIGHAVSQAQSGDTISIGAGTYAEHLDIEKNLTLAGAGAHATVIDGSSSGTVVTIGLTNTVAVVTLSGMTIEHGSTDGTGGGIVNTNKANAASLTLANSMVISNTAAGGGGIASDGPLALTNSTVSGNTAADFGGGIDESGTVTVTSSTISSNSATAFGGGICCGTVALTSSTVISNTVTGDHANGGGIATGGTVTLTNSTVSGNTVTGVDANGGGIGAGTVALTNSTVYGNTATGSGNSGGGIARGTFGTIKSTILAGNSAASGPDCGGNLTSGGYNLLGSAGGCSGLANGVNGDQVGVNLDHLLGPLQDNSGPTWTMAPQPGSPVLDAVPASNCTLTTDQRGQPRPDEAADNGACDIGAVEGAVAPPATPTGTPTSTPLPTATSTATTIPTATPTSPPTTTGPTSALTPSGQPTATATYVACAAPPLKIGIAPYSAVSPSFRLPLTLHGMLPYVTGGDMLPLTVLTAPDATVDASLDVATTAVPYHTALHGAADARGRFRSRMHVAFQPHTPMVATLTVRARTACGTATQRTALTILPLTIMVTPRRLVGGGTATITLHTGVHGQVIITLEADAIQGGLKGQGTQRRVRHPLTLYRVTLHGTADSHGRFSRRVHIAYQPSQPMLATIHVTVRMAQGTAMGRAAALLLPRHHP